MNEERENDSSASDCSAPRKMPTWKQISKHWATVFFDHGWEIDFEILHNKQCFAFGRLGKIQRCHIKARCNGGTDDVKNIHLLCVACHDESETLCGLSYWRWYRHKRYVEFDEIMQKEIYRFKITHPQLFKQND